MAGTLFLPFYAAIDGDGAPMGGAKLYFYLTGTTTPQHTYTASDLVTPNANPVVADADGLFPPIYLAPGPDYKAILKTAADVTVATRDPIQAPQPPATLPAIRSYLAGLTLSTAGSSTSFSVADGSAADSTNAVTMNLAATTKNTNSFAAGSGNGSLDAGTIAINTWYHVHLIYRSDTGGTDILTSLSATAPTLPTNFTHFRRIGSFKINGSAQITGFVQVGDKFLWLAPVLDVNVSSVGTSAVTRTLTVPTGLVIEPIMSVTLDANSATAGEQVYLSSLSQTDVATSGDNVQVAILADGVTQQVAGMVPGVFTNTSAQIRSRLTIGGAGAALRIKTHGWIDRRGRDA
jgi:hypothetical protein